MNFILKYLYFLFVLLFSGLARPFYRSQTGIIVLFFVSLFILIIYKIGFSKRFVHVLIVWMLYGFITTIIYREFHPFFLFRHFTYFIVSYTLIRLFKRDFYVTYEKTIVVLACISLFFWIWQILDYNSLLNFIYSFFSLSSRPEGLINIFIFSTNSLSYHTRMVNYGFAWEPGPYSIYLLVAFLIHFYRTERIFDISSIILIMSLITTQSTTGIISLMILLIYLIMERYKGAEKYFILIPLACLFIIMFINVNFMYNKINTLYVMGKDIDQTINMAAEMNIPITGGRFGGWYIAMNDFLKYPLFGIAGETAKSYGYISENAYVYIVNGWASIISTYGLFGLISYILLLLKSSFIMAKSYNNKYKYALLLILGLSSFGFSLIPQIMLFTFILHGLFMQDNGNNKYININCNINNQY